MLSKAKEKTKREDVTKDVGTTSGSPSALTEHGNDGSFRSEPRIQLYKPAMSRQDWKEVNDLLDRDDLTEKDYFSYLEGSDLPPPRKDHENDIRIKMRRDFHTRRREILQLSQKLATGEARIDQDGRLVPSEPPRPPNADLPPPPPARRNNHENRMAPLVEDLMLNGPGINALGNNGNVNNQDDGPNLTFRRICFAVLAVVTAFVCVILRTLPLMQDMEATGTNFDALLHELLHVKFMKQHLKHCSNLDRDPPHFLQLWTATNVLSLRFWQDRLVQLSGFYSETSCADGVLHVPARQVLADEYWYSDRQEASVMEPYRQGIDHVWNLPCVTPPLDSKISPCYPGSENSKDDNNNKDGKKEGWCSNGLDSKHKCFRGIHDGVISQEETGTVRNLGHRFILNGGDHFDMHYNCTVLQEELPTIMQKLQTLLREKYNQTNLQAIAYRFQTAGPMDFVGVDLNGYASVGLNITNYLNWGERCRRRNEQALYSLPWPFRVKPVRDACKLMADLEADPRFAVHTSIFLSTGAGEHYRGGVTLYADNHRSNYRANHKIQRGMTIDGSLGRVVVSSGGIENRRCRLPTRAGLRRVLQIWWGCRADD